MQATHAKFWATTQPHVMSMPERLDSGTASEMEMNARNFIQSGAQNLVLDCASLTYLTTAGLHALLEVAKLMQNVQGKLSVAGLKGQPKEMFDACHFEQVVKLQDETAADAVAA